MKFALAWTCDVCMVSHAFKFSSCMLSRQSDWFNGQSRPSNNQCTNEVFLQHVAFSFWSCNSFPLGQAAKSEFFFCGKCL